MCVVFFVVVRCLNWLKCVCIDVSVCPSGLRGYVQVVMFSNSWVQIPQLTFCYASQRNTTRTTSHLFCSHTPPTSHASRPLDRRPLYPPRSPFLPPVSPCLPTHSTHSARSARFTCSAADSAFGFGRTVLSSLLVAHCSSDTWYPLLCLSNCLFVCLSVCQFVSLSVVGVVPASIARHLNTCSVGVSPVVDRSVACTLDR